MSNKPLVIRLEDPKLREQVYVAAAKKYGGKRGALSKFAADAFIRILEDNE